jgi:hypothetical protein
MCTISTKSGTYKKRVGNKRVVEYVSIVRTRYHSRSINLSTLTCAPHAHGARTMELPWGKKAHSRLTWELTGVCGSPVCDSIRCEDGVHKVRYTYCSGVGHPTVSKL